MKRLSFGLVLALAACVETGGTTGGGGRVASSSAITEYMVVGNRMSYEDCRTRGGLIIHDKGSPMYLCDPNVIRQVAPNDEFAHPDAVTAPAT